MTEKKVFEYTDVNIKNIVFSNMVKTNENLVSKIWYKVNETDRPQTLNIQTPYLKIQQVKDDKIFLYPGKMETFMDSLDRTSSKFIGNNIQRFGLGGFTFETIVDGETDLVKVVVANGKRPTAFYSKNKSKIDDDNYANILSNCDKIKVIFELDGIIINLKEKTIRNNIIVRDILVSEIEPKSIELTEYSFISDNEQEAPQVAPQEAPKSSDSDTDSEEHAEQFIYNLKNDSASNSSVSSEEQIEKRTYKKATEKPKPKPKAKAKKAR